MDISPLTEQDSVPEWRSLTPGEQWDHLLAHHAGQWNGLLIRFDNTGQVLDILDSVRQFSPSSDRQTITHALDFRSRLNESVTQKQWVLTPGDPLISHPVDPTAYLLFNETAADTMVGRDRTKPESFYFEPYLRIGERRVSVVVMYRGTENSAQPKLFSLFREVRASRDQAWWSNETTYSVQSVTELDLSHPAIDATQVQLDTLQYRFTPPRSRAVTGDFLQFQFPDNIDLTISRDRFQTPYYASLRWTTVEQTRRCSLLYTEPNEAAEVLAL